MQKASTRNGTADEIDQRRAVTIVRAERRKGRIACNAPKHIFAYRSPYDPEPIQRTHDVPNGGDASADFACSEAGLPPATP